MAIVSDEYFCLVAQLKLFYVVVCVKEVLKVQVITLVVLLYIVVVISKVLCICVLYMSVVNTSVFTS